MAEQKRIVEKVEELLARVNAARERLARVPAILKRFRQAVLAAACSGRLTADWRSTRPPQDATALLSDIVSERQTFEGSKREAGRLKTPNQSGSPELPDGWVWASGAQLFAWSSGKFLPKKKVRNGPYPVYGGNGVNGHHAEYLVNHATLAIGRVGALCGNVYLTEGRAWVTDNAIYASYVPAMADLKYLKMTFSQSNLNANAGGSGQPFVNQTMLDAVLVPLPPAKEQHEIVRRVEALFKLADAVEKSVAAATARAHKLTQAILAKAFRGELVPSEAELARREGRDYEPASAFLARIQAQRATPDPTKRDKASRKKRPTKANI